MVEDLGFTLSTFEHGYHWLVLQACDGAMSFVRACIAPKTFSLPLLLLSLCTVLPVPRGVHVQFAANSKGERGPVGMGHASVHGHASFHGSNAAAVYIGQTQ